jgi:ABC-2 type transport system permease protein
MIKALIKKQLAELFAGMFNRSAVGKNGKKQGSKTKIILYALLLLYVVGVFAVLFYGASGMFFDAFSPLGLSWLTFAFLGISAVGIGVITTAFMANSVLYNAKDNDLLLSMPIKPWQIIFARIFTLYFMNFLYSALVMIPCFAAYIMRGNISIGVIVCGIAVILALPLFSLSLSLVLGFLVALASGRIKNKSESFENHENFKQNKSPAKAC